MTAMRNADEIAAERKEEAANNKITIELRLEWPGVEGTGWATVDMDLRVIDMLADGDKRKFGKAITDELTCYFDHLLKQYT